MVHSIRGNALLPGREADASSSSAHGDAEKSPDGRGHRHRQISSEGDPSGRAAGRRSTEMTAKGAEGSQAHKGHCRDRRDA